MIFRFGFGHSAHMKLNLTSGDQKLFKDMLKYSEGHFGLKRY